MSQNIALRNKILDDFGAAMAGGSLIIYGGTAPANGDAALSGNTVAVTHTVTAFNAASGGSKTAQPVADATIANSVNPATFARFTNGAYTAQLSVGLAGSGANVIVNNLNYVAGGNSQIVSITLTKGA